MTVATPSPSANRKCCHWLGQPGRGAEPVGRCHRVGFPANQVTGDDRALNLRRALVDAQRPDVPVQVLEQVPALQSAGPVQLHAAVDDTLRRFGRVQLGHGRPAALPLRLGRAVVAGGRGVDEQPRRFQVGRHVGDPVRHRLLAGQRRRRRPAGHVRAGSSRPARPAPCRPRTRRRWAGTGRGCASRPRSPRRPRRARRPGPTRTPSKASRPIGCGESISSGSPVSPGLSPATANAVTPRARASGVVRANTV